MKKVFLWVKRAFYAILQKSVRIFDDRDKKISSYRTNGYSTGRKQIKPLSVEEANNLLFKRIVNGEELFFSRWGIVEATVVYDFLTRKSISDELRVQATQNAGIFPNTVEYLRFFSKIYSSAAKEITILNAWFWLRGESRLFKQFTPNALLVSSHMSYPFLLAEPWTFALEGKKVLVIHPFSETIKSQYEKRELLFENKKVLPSFTLVVYKSVQSIGGSNEFSTWDSALSKMYEDIAKLDFDIALIGCGAYGMPIGAYIKKILKKQAIHIGGVLQILFGIKGKRWEGSEQNYNFDTILYNEHWVRPSDNDKPLDFEKVENGCYW